MARREISVGDVVKVAANGVREEGLRGRRAVVVRVWEKGIRYTTYIPGYGERTYRRGDLRALPRIFRENLY